ncbi:MAG TPA: FAD-dependent monooxygenase [Caulobacteraceae bacterium]|jgi:2-polyprenyl-6-methoxyphenol hydroxylase-like FAD-dependent oxidoreductase|nr:FAD-dependent monooxygenase [Caulobacteraceae bacterium]
MTVSDEPGAEDPTPQEPASQAASESAAPESAAPESGAPEPAAETPTIAPSPAAESPAPAAEAPPPAKAARKKPVARRGADGDTQVLIVGAGPTGLVLAIWLTHLGVRVRILDKAMHSGLHSRALAVQGRTLELYRQVGLADAVSDAGAHVKAVNLWVDGERKVSIDIGGIGAGLSPYPDPTIFPQDEHEVLLGDKLKSMGVEIERGYELIDFDDDARGVTARFKSNDGEIISMTADWIAGCDGARSAVRHRTGVGFRGGEYARVFYVADAEISGPVADGALHVAMDTADFLAVFPMKGQGRARLIGAVVPRLEGVDLDWSDVSPDILRRMQVTVDKVNWFSTYKVHHRMADRFRAGRAFLLGDAAHIHSPVGGQGMNTGIGDAINLAWKLAAVLKGAAPQRLLDTYSDERVAFARRLIATTDQAFQVVSNPGKLAQFGRLDVIPTVVPLLFAADGMRRFLYRTVSQIGVHYHGSALSAGGAGYVRGGDRLAWVKPSRRANTDNFTPIDGLDWQVHVYGDVRPGLQEACARRGLKFCAFPWREAMREAGFMRNAAYLVRPDGYVGLADPHASAVNLERYLDSRGLTALGGATAQAAAEVAELAGG